MRARARSRYNELEIYQGAGANCKNHDESIYFIVRVLALVILLLENVKILSKDIFSITFKSSEFF